MGYHDVVKVARSLIQDPTIVQHWRRFANLLSIPDGDQNLFQSMYHAGTTTPFEIFHKILEIWVSQEGELNLTTLRDILREGDFNSAADQLYYSLTVVQPTTYGYGYPPRPPPSPDQPEDFATTVPPHQGSKKKCKSGLDSLLCCCSCIRPRKEAESDKLQDDLIPDVDYGFPIVSITARGFKIIELINSGAFGDVFKIKKTYGSSRYWAMKKIAYSSFLKHTTMRNQHTEYFSRLLREVETLSRMAGNPHIVQYYDHWFHGPIPVESHHPGSAENLRQVEFDTSDRILPSPQDASTFLFIRMELCGDNLNFWMTLNPSRSLEICDDIILQIARGLEAMHSRGICHRDLKPGNVVLCDNEGGPNREDIGSPWVKIADFGLARDFEADNTISLTKAGTPTYRSPEMINTGIYDSKTDIFSLGLIYLMLINRQEIDKMTYTDSDCYLQGFKVASKQNKRIAGVEARFGKELSVWRGMLEINPEDRMGASEIISGLVTQFQQQHNVQITEV